MKKFKNLLRDKSGSISIVTVILVSILLPLLLFIYVEFNYSLTIKERCQIINDNIASSAIMSIDETNLQDGMLEIDDIKAEEIATKLMAESYYLNSDLTLNNDSLLREEPELKVYVVNETSDYGTEFVTDEGYKFMIYNPSVIVYTNVKPRGIIFDKAIELQSLTVKQVQFDKSESQKSITSSPVNGNITFYVDEVINPYEFNEDNPFEPVMWNFTKLPLSAGTNLSFSANVNDINLEVNSVNARIRITGTDYNKNFLIPMSATETIVANKLSLSTNPTPSSDISTWVIYNPYSKKIAVDWFNITRLSGGKVFANPKGYTYFETPIGFLGSTVLLVTVNGKSISNGLLTATKIIAPRSYVPVDNNNASGFSNVSSNYLGNFLLPENIPNNAQVYISIEARGTNNNNNLSETRYFPSLGAEAQFGYIQNNINELIKINKIN
ncbi:MAG: hypothetical protein K0R54_7 [Clostridiaceae bacterium]|jgi:hypothetical protein|nr:hypothetical protein [Clostridiaceae bacterium]